MATRKRLALDARGPNGGRAPMGALERWSAAAPIPHVFGVCAQLQQPLSLPAVAAAMSVLSRRHALLRAELLSGIGSPAGGTGLVGVLECFCCSFPSVFGAGRGVARVPRVTPSHFLVRSVAGFDHDAARLPVRVAEGARGWAEVFAEESGRPWTQVNQDPSLPRTPLLLWRVLLLPGGGVTPQGDALLLVAHPALGDAASGLAIVEEVLECLAGRGAGLLEAEVGLERVLENDVDVEPEMADVFSAVAPSPLAGPFFGLDTGPARSPLPSAAADPSLPLLFTPPPVSSVGPLALLLDRCAAAGTTLQDCLSAAACFALAGSGLAAGGRTLRLLLTTPLSVRRRAGIPPRAVGSFEVPASTAHELAPATRFRDLCAAIHDAVAADAPRAARSAGLLGLLGDDIGALALRRCKEARPAMRTATLAVSCRTAEAAAPGAVVRLAHAAHCDGPLLAVDGVSSGEGVAAVLAVSVTWPEPLLGRQGATAFAAALCRCLDAFASGADFLLAEFLAGAPPAAGWSPAPSPRPSSARPSALSTIPEAPDAPPAPESRRSAP